MKSTKFLVLGALLLTLALVVAACGGAGQPTTSAAPATSAPAQPTTAATQPTTAAAQPTTAAAQPTTAAPSGAVTELTVWNGYSTGSAEEKALSQLITKAQTDMPDIKVNMLQIPFSDLFNKYETESAAGGGPDMWTAPNDNLGNEVRAGLLAPLDDQLKGKLDAYSPLAVQGVTVDGKLYAVPVIVKAVALYYNKDTVPTPPKTTDELLQLVKSGKKLALNQSAYHNFGFSGAFGGKLMDDSGKCIADQGGWADALQYMADLKAAGAQFETDGAKADALFRQGQVDMIINGPWTLGDYKASLGDKLGVALMPAGPKGNANPLSGIDGWYINANATDAKKAAAVKLALYLTSADAQKVYADVAGSPSVRTDVTASDPLVGLFAQVGAAGFPRPQSKEFGNFWAPFGDMVTKVLEGKSKPADAVAEACTTMNKASGK